MAVSNELISGSIDAAFESNEQCKKGHEYFLGGERGKNCAKQKNDQYWWIAGQPSIFTNCQVDEVCSAFYGWRNLYDQDEIMMCSLDSMGTRGKRKEYWRALFQPIGWYKCRFKEYDSIMFTSVVSHNWYEDGQVITNDKAEKNEAAYAGIRPSASFKGKVVKTVEDLLTVGCELLTGQKPSFKQLGSWKNNKKSHAHVE